MTTASAKVIIDAEDLASKKIADAAKAIEQNVKNIKDVGGKAKASTEFIGTLATSLGGSEIGSYASQLAGLTDKVSQFSEVSKAGSAGALAFKAGLVAAVAAIAFKVGEAFGNVIFNTAKMTREFERAKDAASDLNNELAKSRDQSFSDRKEDIELIRDPKEKRAAQEALFKQLDNDVQGITNQLKNSTKIADEWADAWQITGDRKAYAEEAQKQIEIDKQRLEQAKAHRDELRRELSDRKAINDQIKADNAAILKAEQEAVAAEKAKVDKSDAYLESLSKQLGMLEAAAAGKEALIGETAAQNTFGEQAQYEAEQMLVQINTLKEKADLEKKAADLKEKELERLKEQRILLEQGAEAAKAYNLEQQGLDKATAERIAKEEASLEKQKKEKDALSKIDATTQQLGSQAVQSRLLTRGPAEKGIDKIAKNTEQTVEALDRLARELKDYGPPPPQLEVVG